MHNRTNEDSTRRRCNTHTHGVSNHSKEEPPKTRVSDQRKEQQQTKSPTTEKNHGDSKQQSTTNPNGWTSRTPVKGRVTTSFSWDGWVSVYDWDTKAACCRATLVAGSATHKNKRSVHEVSSFCFRNSHFCRVPLQCKSNWQLCWHKTTTRVSSISSTIKGVFRAFF